MTQPNTQAPADEREEFEAWCIGNGYSIRFVPGGLWVDGQPVYDDPRTHAAWWAWQDRATLASQPAQAETVVPEGWKLVLVEDGEPGNEPDWDEVLRQAEVATGIKVERNTYSIIIREVRRWLLQCADHTPPQAQPAPVAVDEREALTPEQRHTINCADAWAKAQGLPTYSHLHAALQSARSGQASSRTRLICDSCGHRGVESEFLSAGTYICPACGDADVSEDGGDAGGEAGHFTQDKHGVWHMLPPGSTSGTKLYTTPQPAAVSAAPAAPVQAGQGVGEDAAQDDQPPEGKQWFYCTTTVTIVQGWQQWRVAASSLEEAKAVFEEEGGEFVGEELEVRYLDSPEWERAANKEGQSHE